MSFRAHCVIWACVTTAAPHLEAQIRRPTIQKIDAFFSDCVGHGWSGSVLLAVQGKVVLHKGYGLANRARRLKNRKDTLFEVASTTKAITGLAILKLQQLGKLRVEDSIAKHLPNVPPSQRDITIYHLLTHTSGRPGDAGGRGRTIDEAVRLAFMKSPSELRDEGKSPPPAPGTKFQYWNGGYALLAAIVDRYGTGYERFCRKHILKPAGMKASGFTGETVFPLKQLATGYAGTTAVRSAAQHPYGAYDYRYRGMGGLVTSVKDLWSLDRALRDESVLPADLLEFAYRPAKAGKGRKYGCGWETRISPTGAKRIEHGGDVKGFHTDFIRLVEENGCLIIASNVDHVPRWGLSYVVESLLEKRTPKSRPPKATPIAKSKLKKLEGRFRTSTGAAIEITAGRSGLWIRGDRKASPQVALEYVDVNKHDVLMFAAHTADGFVRHGWGRGPTSIVVGKKGKTVSISSPGRKTVKFQRSR